MGRRDFLRTTFAGGMAVGVSGCASALVEPQAPLSRSKLERKLARLDRTLARMDGRMTRKWFLAHRADDLESGDEDRQVRVALDGELTRASLCAALTVSTVSQLPEANKSDPAVIERLRRVSGEADFAVFGSLARLRNLDQAELDALDREAAEDPEFVKDVVESIDGLSGELGVAPESRRHLRSVANHVGWRLSRGRFSSLLEETLSKVDGLLGATMRQVDDEGVPAYASQDPTWTALTLEAMRLYGEPAVPDPPGEQASPDRPPVQRPATGEASGEAPPDVASSPSEPVAEAVPPPEVAPADASEPSSSQADQLAAKEAELEAREAKLASDESRRSSEQRQAEAKLESQILKRNIYLGVGGGLTVLGGVGLGVGLAVGSAALAIVGAVALTGAVVMLILAIVAAVRVAGRRRELESLSD